MSKKRHRQISSAERRALFLERVRDTWRKSRDGRDRGGDEEMASRGDTKAELPATGEELECTRVPADRG